MCGDHKKKFQGLRDTKRRLFVLHNVLKAKGMMESIFSFFEECYNRGDLIFLLATAIDPYSVVALEREYPSEKLHECQIDPNCDLGRRIFAFAVRSEVLRLGHLYNRPSQSLSYRFVQSGSAEHWRLACSFSVEGSIQKVVLKLRPLRLGETIVEGLRIFLANGDIKDIGILPLDTRHWPSWAVKVDNEFGVSITDPPDGWESAPAFKTFSVPKGQWLHNARVEMGPCLKNVDFYTNADGMVSSATELPPLAFDKRTFSRVSSSWRLSQIGGDLRIADDGLPAVCAIEFSSLCYKPETSYYKKLINLA